MKLTKLFSIECIESITDCDGMPAVIRQLIGGLVKANRIDPQSAPPLIDELDSRERLVTSALGKGFAFPHLRTRMVDQFTGAIGVAANGLHLDSLDGLPTKLILLVLSPWDQREVHLGILSRLVHMVDDKVVTLRMHHEFCDQDIWNYLHDIDALRESNK
ncbi:MAG: PTS sugar transporter subunit IIA [Rubripirellula sp.]